MLELKEQDFTMQITGGGLQLMGRFDPIPDRIWKIDVLWDGIQKTFASDARTLLPSDFLMHGPVTAAETTQPPFAASPPVVISPSLLRPEQESNEFL